MPDWTIEETVVASWTIVDDGVTIEWSVVTNMVDANAAGSIAAAQAFAIQRANHTGTQAVSTITGLQALLDAAAGGGVIEADWSVRRFVLDGDADFALDPITDFAGWEAVGPAKWGVPEVEGPQRILYVDTLDLQKTGVYVYTPTVSFVRADDADTVPKLNGKLVSAKLLRHHTDQTVMADYPYYLTNLVHLWADDPAAAMGVVEWQYAGYTDLVTVQKFVAYLQAQFDGPHPVQVFTPALYVPLSTDVVGGSIVGDTLTVAALAGGGPFPIPLGRSIILGGQADPAENGAYRALTESGTYAGFSDGVFVSDPVELQPFTEAHADKAVFSFNPFASTSYSGQVVRVFDGFGAVTGYEIVQFGVPSPLGVVDGAVLTKGTVGDVDFYDWSPLADFLLASDLIPLTDRLDILEGAAPAAVDVSPGVWGAPDDEYESLQSTALCMRTMGSDGWSTPNLGNTPDGIDIRMKFRLHRPVEMVSHRYGELLTQESDAIPINWGGDNFELAVMWNDPDFFNTDPPVPLMFWEHTPDRALYPTVDGEVGYLADIGTYLPGSPGNPFGNRGTSLVADVGFVAGEWATIRLVQDTALETVSFYREVIYAGDVITTDGRHWRLVRSWTWEHAGSMEPGVATAWKIGIRANVDIAWMECWDGPDDTVATKLIDLQPSHFATAGVGATAVTDGVANVWTAVTLGQVGYVSPIGAILAAL